MHFDLIKNSLLVGAGTVLLAASLGLFTALWATALESHWGRLIGFFAVMSLAMPPFTQVNCWLDLLGASGSLRPWLPLNIYSKPGAIWILALLLWPIFFAFAVSAWSRIEAAQIESDTALRGIGLVRWLLWPMARISIGQAALLVFVLAVNNFAVPALLQVRVLPAQIWLQFETKLDPLAALVTSLPLVLAAGILLWFWRKEELRFAAESPATTRALRRQIGAPLCSICAVISIALLLLTIALPAWQLISARRTWTELAKVVFAVSDVLRHSIVLPAAAALLCTVLGVLLARWRFGWLFWFALFLPGILIGIGLVSAFNRGAFDLFYRSVGVMVVAWTMRYLALSWHATRSAFSSIDPQLIDVARTNGARGWNLFRHVQWPQSANRIALAGYIIYLLCLWDIETIILILPPGGETLAIRIFGLLHYGHNNQVNALCLLLVGAAIAPLLVWHLARRVKCWATLALALLLVTGCTKTESSDPLVKSRFFRTVEVIGHRGAGAGEFNKPRSVAVDSSDNLYVVDMTGRVQKFSPEGRFLLSWQMPETDLGKAKGMARDAQGNIIVVEPHYQRVNHFSPDGKLVAQWGKSGTNRGELTLPRSVAVNSRGDIFLSEYTRVDRVQGFRLSSPLDGEKIPQTAESRTDSMTRAADSPSPLNGERIPLTNDSRIEPLNRPPGLPLPKGEGRGEGEGSVLKYRGLESKVRLMGRGNTASGDQEGIESKASFIALFGQPGTGPGEFNRAEGLGIDSQDRLYVADSCNHRIQVFDPRGKWLRAYGQPGKNPGQMSYPYDIRIDAAGNQYVCEFGNSRIQIFDSHDQPLELVGGAGAGAGQLSNPWSIALDSRGNLYVADAGNHRVQKFIRR